MAAVDPAQRRKRERQVRGFGLIVQAVAPSVLASFLLLPDIAEWAGFGLVQRSLIVYALVAQVAAMAVSWRAAPVGAALTTVRALFFSAYAGLAGGALLLMTGADWEILVLPLSATLIGLLHTVYERCTTHFEAFRT